MKKREILIEEDFSTCLAIRFVTELEALEKESEEPVTVLLSSYGGSVPACMTMIDACRRSPCPIGVIALGTAMSAGAFFLTAGASKGLSLAFPNTQIMYHEARGYVAVNDDSKELLTLATDTFITMMADTLDKSEEEIAAIISQDYYIMADDALEDGWIDGIVGTDRGLA